MTYSSHPSTMSLSVCKMCTDTAEPSVKVVLSKSTCGDALAGPGEVTEWGGWPARPATAQLWDFQFSPAAATAPPPFSILLDNKNSSVVYSSVVVSRALKTQSVLLPGGWPALSFLQTPVKWRKWLLPYWFNKTPRSLLLQSWPRPRPRPGARRRRRRENFTFYKYFNLGMYLKNVFQSISFGACGYE